MTVRFVFATIVSFIILAMPAPAQADYVLLQDPDTGLSFSYPDTWKIVNNRQPDDIITIMAPSGRAHAACRVRANVDRRYMVYPPRFSGDVQQVAYSEEFWHRYLAEYNNPTIYNLRDESGLGRGYSGFAEAGYWSAVPGPLMPRRAVMFASLYNGVAYVTECSAHADAFAEWYPQFMGIVKSVDFPKQLHEVPHGDYRNFMRDRRILFSHPKHNAVTSY